MLAFCTSYIFSPNPNCLPCPIKLIFSHMAFIQIKPQVKNHRFCLIETKINCKVLGGKTEKKAD